MAEMAQGEVHRKSGWPPAGTTLTRRVRAGRVVWLAALALGTSTGRADELAPDEPAPTPAVAVSSAIDPSPAVAAWRVPEGFAVSLFADDELAHDIFALTFDAAGRPVVSGPGYVRALLDDDGDGRADRARDLPGAPESGAQGLCFVGGTLYFTGDKGLWRVDDKDGDGWPETRGPGPVIALANPEHGAHAIVEGPDGALYVVCGNDAGLERRSSNPAARDEPPVVAGGIVRLARDGSWRVIADGFRNPYDLAFGPGGQPFTVDSDGERVEHLPWYTPTRLYDVAYGRGHGWVEEGWVESWSQPAWWPDNVPRVAELGRGSPTGLECYRHWQFPPRYRGGLFSACWTLGRVYFCPLEASGSSFRAVPEVFLEATGEIGFAPVDVAVGPRGDLWVAIGGRGTRGGVFRISYPGGNASAPDVPAEVNDGPSADLQELLTAPQPLAAWSRARWQPLAARLGAETLRRAAANAELPTEWRVRAVEILVDRFADPLAQTAALVEVVARGRVPELEARLAWALGAQPASAPGWALLGHFTTSDEPTIARAAWEGLMRVTESGRPPATPALEPPAAVPADGTVPASRPDYPRAFAARDARVRWAAIELARRTQRQPGEEEFFSRLAAGGDPRQRLACLWREAGRDDSPEKLARRVDECLQIFAATDDPALALEAVRLIELALGDALTRSGQRGELVGYHARAPERLPVEARQAIVTALEARFPSGDAPLDRELSRTLAWLEAPTPALLEAVTRRWSAASRLVDDIHHLLVAARLPGPRTVEQTSRTARALLALDAKLAAEGDYPSRAWPEWIERTLDALVVRDPALPSALVASPELTRPAQARWVLRLGGEAIRPGAERLLAAAGDPAAEQAWTPELIQLWGYLPVERVAPRLRPLADDPLVRGEILRVLARHPQPEDRGLFVEALADSDADQVRRGAEALRELGPPAGPDELRQVLVAGDRLAQDLRLAEGETAASELERRRWRQTIEPALAALSELAARWMAPQIEADAPPPADGTAGPTALESWSRLAERARAADPALAASPAVAANDAATLDRLSRIAWDQGDAARGGLVFAKRSCAACHAGRERLGPTLAGITRRLGRHDLWTAIVDPHREVAPPYRLTLVMTREGRVYQGLVVYESPESTLLQTGAGSTVRILGDDLAVRRLVTQSLMPRGLLDEASDQDVADLFAYLATLETEPGGRKEK